MLSTIRYLLCSVGFGMKQDALGFLKLNIFKGTTIFQSFQPPLSFLLSFSFTLSSNLQLQLN